MPRVHHVKKARKDNPAVKAGEPYYWWAFRYGGKHFSATYPKASQLTQSPYLSTIHSLIETVDETTFDSSADFISLREDVVSQLEELWSETEHSLSNMPYHLQEDSILSERIHAMDYAQSEIINLDETSLTELEDEEGQIDEKLEEQYNEAFHDLVETMKSSLEECLI